MTRRAVQCGTYSGYRTHLAKQQTPCEPCRDACRDYSRKLREGRPRRLVDAAPSRDRVRAWMADGATLVTIAEALGVGRATLDNIANGRTLKVTRHVADAIARDAEPDFGEYIPAAGTHRRLMALNAMGWSSREVSRRLGHEQKWAARVMQSKRVSRKTAADVAAIYDELSMTPGPSGWAAARARKAGAVPPLGWDDAHIDDPSAWADMGADEDDEPDPVVVDRLLAGHMTWRDAAYADRLEAARRVIGRPGGPKFCEAGLGLNSSTIARIRQEAAA